MKLKKSNYIRQIMENDSTDPYIKTNWLTFYNFVLKKLYDLIKKDI